MEEDDSSSCGIVLSDAGITSNPSSDDEASSLLRNSSLQEFSSMPPPVPLTPVRTGGRRQLQGGADDEGAESSVGDVQSVEGTRAGVGNNNTNACDVEKEVVGENDCGEKKNKARQVCWN